MTGSTQVAPISLRPDSEPWTNVPISEVSSFPDANYQPGICPLVITPNTYVHVGSDTQRTPLSTLLDAKLAAEPIFLRLPA